MVEVLYFARYVLGLLGESEMGLGWAANGLKRLDKGGDERPQLFLHDCNVQTSEMEPGIFALQQVWLSCSLALSMQSELLGLRYKGGSSSAEYH